MEGGRSVSRGNKDAWDWIKVFYPGRTYRLE